VRRRELGRGGIKVAAQVVGASVAAARVLCRCAEVGPGVCPTPERRPVLARLDLTGLVQRHRCRLDAGLAGLYRAPQAGVQ
jgi:hypothetical protein